MRTFVAFPVSEPLLSYVKNIQEELKRRGVKGKWVPPINQHLTVLFLGDQEKEQINELGRHLQHVRHQHSAFDMRPAAVSTLGRPPRVVHLSWDKSSREQFALLGETVKQAVRRVGMKVEQKVMDREVLPHVTLLRFRHRKEAHVLRHLGDLGKDGFHWHEPLPEPDFSTVRFQNLCIYASILHPEGPEYQKLDSVKLPAPQ